MPPGLLDVCKQFEAVLLRSLWPVAALQPFRDDDRNALMPGAVGNERGAIDDLFGQAFACAMEQAGGTGLANEIARKLSGVAR